MDINETGKVLFHDNEFIAKNDKDKPRLFLVSPYLIEAVGHIRTYGTNKYGSAENWKKVSKERYQDALMRHLISYMKNNKGVDEESGYPHLWHVACNINFLIELEEQENDR